MTSKDKREAARLLRLWAPTIHAIIQEDWDEVTRLSDGVDPIDCMALNAMLEVEAMVLDPVRTSVRQRTRCS